MNLPMYLTDKLSHCCGALTYLVGEQYACKECGEWCDAGYFCPKCDNQVLREHGLCERCV